MPAALLKRLLSIEEQLGRTRPYWGAPRIIDLDLILYGDVQRTRPACTSRTCASASASSCWSRSPRSRPTGRSRSTGKTVAELLADLG